MNLCKVHGIVTQSCGCIGTLVPRDEDMSNLPDLQLVVLVGLDKHTGEDAIRKIVVESSSR